MKENYSYYSLKKVIDYLVDLGADRSLFELPAVKERLKRKIKSSSDVLEDVLSKEGYVVINSDGTFQIGELQIFRCDKDSPNGFIHIKDHEKSCSEGKSGIETVYESYLVYTDISSDVIVDKNGIEIEGDYLDTEHDTRQSSVYERTDTRRSIKTHLKREKDGTIKGSSNPKNNGDFTYYDIGNWELAKSSKQALQVYPGYITDIMNLHEENTRYLNENYSGLSQYCSESEKRLRKRLYNDIEKENSELRNNNEKLQLMLEKALAFVKEVKDSKIGKKIFGKKASEILNSKNKKTFPEER